MRYFLILSLLIFTSCASGKSSYTHFVECEEIFSEFTNLSSCALEKIQKDCNNNKNCRNKNSRFVDAINRLKIMIENDEISENEAMFRYYNLIDYEESKFMQRRNMDLPNYYYNPYHYYVQRISSCYISRTSFCY